MPELPEVETVKRVLKNKLSGLVIKNIKLNYAKTIEYPLSEIFIKNIINQKINDVKRRGKWLIFDLDDYYLLSHLRMEGKYNFKSNGDLENKHEHVIFYLSDNTELRYQDTRKFGRMHLINKADLDTYSKLLELGYEPWDDQLTVKYLKDKYKNKKLAVKSVVLDQSIIVGIGNIYADEILFLSHINPLKSANLLTDKELTSIIVNTKDVLTKAIALGGTTIRTFSAGDNHGNFQDQLLVHGKEKQACLVCGDIIKKIKVGGRGTYYCPTCQK